MSTSEITASSNKGILENLIPSKDLPIYGKSVTDPNADVFNQPIKFMEKIVITKENGKWLVNGKPYDQISYSEKVFFDKFIAAMNYDYEQQK